MRSTIPSTTIAATAIVASSFALGSGIAGAAVVEAAVVEAAVVEAAVVETAFMQDGDAVYITTGPADRCQPFADEANRALSTGDSAGARQIADSAQAQDCTLVLVVP